MTCFSRIVITVIIGPNMGEKKMLLIKEKKILYYLGGKKRAQVAR